MKQLFAIIKITILSATRSYVFQTLLAALIICAIGLPLLLTGDGTPLSHIRLTLDYTVSVISVIIILSILWMSCSVMNQDLDQYQMHIVSVKPISRTKIWLGKFLGILLIHTILLGITFVVFFIYIFYDLKNSNYSEKDISSIEKNILTGRKKVFPELSYINKEFHKKWTEKQKEMKDSGKTLTPAENEYLKISTYYQTITQGGQVEPEKDKIFEFNDTKQRNEIVLKFRIFVGEPDLIERQNKPTAKGCWQYFDFTTSKYITIENSDRLYVSNIFYEINIPGDNISSKGKIRLKYINESKGTSVFFQLTESPILFITDTSFLFNYLRAFIVIFLSLVMVTGIGCAFGGIFSFPIAVFVLIAYLLTGSISNFIISSEAAGNISGTNTNPGISLSRNLLNIIAPLNKFEISEDLSNGALIANDKIVNLILWYIILRELPLILISIFVYSKRELGLIIKK